MRRNPPCQFSTAFIPLPFYQWQLYKISLVSPQGLRPKGKQVMQTDLPWHARSMPMLWLMTWSSESRKKVLLPVLFRLRMRSILTRRPFKRSQPPCSKIFLGGLRTLPFIRPRSTEVFGDRNLARDWWKHALLPWGLVSIQILNVYRRSLLDKIWWMRIRGKSIWLDTTAEEAVV